MTRCLFLFAPLLAVLQFVAPAAHAAESYDNCTGFITTLPTVIGSQGTWCLKTDLATAINSGSAISVNTNNVTIDCNNFKLGGLAAGAGTGATGIGAYNRQNVTIRHCSIRGFFNGVALGGATGGNYSVEDNTFTGNTYIGIDVESDDSLIRRNRVFDTGGSTFANDPRGMYVSGNVDVLDNTIGNVTANSNGNATGISLTTGTDGNGSISGNRIHGLLPNGTGTALGIMVPQSIRIAITGNQLTGTGGAGDFGITCTNDLARARDNLINGFGTAFTGCGDAGGNDINP